MVLTPQKQALRVKGFEVLGVLGFDLGCPMGLPASIVKGHTVIRSGFRDVANPPKGFGVWEFI